MYGQDLTPVGFITAMPEAKLNLCMSIFNEVKDDWELKDDIHSVADALSTDREGACITLWGYANLGYAFGSGSYPKCIAGYIEQGQTDAWEAFREANVNTYECLTMDSLREDFDYGVDEEVERMLDDYYEVEYDSLIDSGTYFYKVQLIQDIDGIIVRAYVNVDFEYGRDYIGKWYELQGGNPDCVRNEYIKALSWEEITEENIEAVIEELCKAVYA